MSSSTPFDEQQRTAQAAANAAASVLPAGEPLHAGAPVSGTDAVLEGFAGAVVADLEAPIRGRIAVLVGPDLVGALAASPLGGLDLAAALQPTVDAAAGALGAAAGAARQVGLELVLGDLGSPFTAVPLVGGTPVATLLLPDDVVAATVTAPAGSQPHPVAEVTPAVAAAPSRGGDLPRGIELLHGVDMEVTVEIGRTRMTVRELLDLAPGAVLELDRAAGSPADLLVNGRLIARGEVVVIDEDFGLRITEIAVDAAAG
ncbi:flagellar motor switch protein FliN [Nocardioides pyridinolyticus]